MVSHSPGHLRAQVLAFSSDFNELLRANISEIDANALQTQFLQRQAQFQAILQAFSTAELDPALEQQVLPLQTEAHRRLRLLGVDVMRLRAAKHPEALAKGRSQIQAHLTQIQQFVEAIAQALDDA